MNSDFDPPHSPQEEVEARLTALLLGQLSDDEATALQQAIAADPELQRRHARLKETIELVRKTAASPGQEGLGSPGEPRLSRERREKLLRAFKVTRPQELQALQASRVRRRELALLAAMLVALLSVGALVLFFQNQSSHLTLAGHQAAPQARPESFNNSMSPSEDVTFQWKELPEKPSETYFQRRARYSGRSGGSGPSAGVPPSLPPPLPPPDPSSAETAPARPARSQSFSGPSEAKVEAKNVEANRPANGLIPPTTGQPEHVGVTLGGTKQTDERGSVPIAQAGSESDRRREQQGLVDELRLGREPSPSHLFYEATKPKEGVVLEGLAERNYILGDTIGTASDGHLIVSPEQRGFGNTLTTNGGMGAGLVQTNWFYAGYSPDAGRIPTAGITPTPTPMPGGAPQDPLARDNSGKEPEAKSRPAAATSPSDPAKVSGPSLAFDVSGTSGMRAMGGGRPMDAAKDVLKAEAGKPGEEAKQLEKLLAPSPNTKQSQLLERLDTIRIGELKSDALPLSHVIETLNAELRKTDPTSKGINFLFKDRAVDTPPAHVNATTGLPVVDAKESEELGAVAVRLPQPLRNVTVHQALTAIAEAVDRPIQLLVENYGVVITDREEASVRKKVDQEPESAPQPVASPAAPTPQPEIQTAENAYSTFSLNVSDVSFRLAAASLEQGRMPDVSTVRTEEFINAFDYRDPEPPPGVPIGFHWERASYPFAHHRNLLRFSLKTAASGRPSGRPLNLVLLLDNSGSMERADRVRIRQECLRVLAAQLQATDRISVVAFARTPRLWVDGLPGAQAGELSQRVGNLSPEGGTNLEEALHLAYQTARRHFQAAGINRVVLLTDGAANLGEVQPELLKKQVESHRQQGVALDCFGIGWDGYNDHLLETLSRNGDGRYGFVNTPEEAAGKFAGQLAGALRVAASDLKVQVEFNPRRVIAHRQMGYAKHQLKKEQFRDNTVDAAELGAAEAGNALYVVEINPRGEGPLGVVRVRFKVPGTQDYREHQWPLPYDGPARSFEQASPAMRLAGVASAFSEWLVASPFAGEVTTDALLRFLNNVPEAYPSDPRPQQLEWMLRQAKSLTGK